MPDQSARIQSQFLRAGGSRCGQVAEPRHYPSVDRNRVSFRAKIYTFLDKTWLRLVDELVAVSENVQEILQKMLPQKQCALISNGIDVQRFQQVTPEQRLQYRKQLGVAENDLLIGTIGRLVPEKGYQYFIESAAALSQELPNIKFAIIGDGELREDLVSQTRKKISRNECNFWVSETIFRN